MKKKSRYKSYILIVSVLFLLCIVLLRKIQPAALEEPADETYQTQETQETQEPHLPAGITDIDFDYSAIPPYTGDSYVEINGNQPSFTEDQKTTIAFEYYSDLDSLGRCGIAAANVCQELMPTEARSPIGMIKPSGWHTARYDDLVEGKYLYNRCHLIAFHLAGENDNPLNLITGTRYLNVVGMMPFENRVGNYVRSTGNHVLYRTSPVFVGDELVARGVHLEAFSIEDQGEGICFNVFLYNVQPGIEIDYLTGESSASWTNAASTASADPNSRAYKDQGQDNSEAVLADADYIVNILTGTFHLSGCSGIEDISEENKEAFFGTHDEAIAVGYTPCGICEP